MIITVKQAGFLTESNKDGSDLEISGPSDTLGGTSTATVSDGDVVADIVVDPVTSAISVALWGVVDGDSWAEDITLNEGDVLVVTGTGIEYQKGLAAIVLADGTLGPLNLPIIFEVAGA